MATAEALQQAARDNPQWLAQAFTGALREFGYAGLEERTVLDEINNFQDGDDPKGVIGMFVHGWLRDGMDS